jgi:hypothetical protein
LAIKVNGQKIKLYFQAMIQTREETHNSKARIHRGFHGMGVAVQN